MRFAASVVLTAIFFGSAVASAQTEEAVAQTRFNKGRELFIAGQFTPALVEFRAASALYESPNTRLYIARCERELGHNASAFIELGRAASEAADRSRADPRYASTRDVAKQEANALEPKLAHVTVLAPNGMPDGVTITVNGEALNAAAVGVAAPIDPGPVEVVASAAGYVTEKKSTRAAAGESVEIKLRLEKDPNVEVAQTPNIVTTVATTPANNATTTAIVTTTTRDESPRASHGLRNAGFVVGGIGIAGMGVFAAFAGLAQTRYDQLKSQCGGPCDAELQLAHQRRRDVRHGRERRTRSGRRVDRHGRDHDHRGGVHGKYFASSSSELRAASKRRMDRRSVACVLGSCLRRASLQLFWRPRV